jgi:ATP-dependent Clp protease ATP-binding subunit ClpX
VRPTSSANAEPEDLIKFGLIPELVGRLPVMATLGELTIDAMVQILTEPQERAGQAVPEAVCDGRCRAGDPASALPPSPSKALARKTGARGLRSILEHSLIDTMFDLPTSGWCGQGRGRRAHRRRRRQAPARVREKAKASA